MDTRVRAVDEEAPGYVYTKVYNGSNEMKGAVTISI